MQITCPQCSSKFNLPDKMIRPNVKLRCTVCNNIFQLPNSHSLDKTPLSKSYEIKNEDARLPEMKKQKNNNLKIWLLISAIIACLTAVGSYFFLLHDSDQTPTIDPIKNVELLTMRNVRQYNLMNEKVGKVFVIEGKVVNEFPEPRDFIELEGAIYDKDKNTIAAKKQLAGSQLSLFQLQVLNDKEMDSFLNNKMEIYANNTNVPPGGEVPFMILFYTPPDNVAEFGVKIVDAKKSTVQK